MTKEVFGESPALFLEIDPEGGDEYTVVEVPVKGNIDEIFSQTQLWHRRLAREFTERIPFVLSPLFA